MRYGQKHFYTQLKCMSLPLSPYLSQILTKLLETLISIHGIKIPICVCNAREVILFLFGTINFVTKDWLQPVWTAFFCVVDRLGPVFKDPVAVPEYLNWSRPVAVASCLILGRKKLDLMDSKTLRSAFLQTPWSCKFNTSLLPSFLNISNRFSQPHYVC